MNSPVITTNPAPPSGVTPTEVPLGISGTISETVMPVNIPMVKELPIFNQRGRGLYIGSFNISSTQNVGTNVFSWAFDSPTTVSGSNLYSRTLRNGSVFYPSAWEYIVAMYSRMVQIDFDIEFIPVKVGDSRCSVDILFNFEDTIPAYNTRNLSNESMHKVLDDMDDPFRFSVPAFWLTNNCSTRATYDSIEVNTSKSPFIPKTRLVVYIRNKYQPNLMQPQSFNVIVILHPKVKNPIGLAPVNPYARNITGDILAPDPWFI
jgi:hypothetical protein